MRRILLVNLLILSVFASVSYWTEEKEKLEAAMENRVESAAEETDDFIKWVDFDVSKFALSEAYKYDRDSYGTDAHISWIDLLAWTAAHTGGVFDNDRTVYSCMQELEEQVTAGEKLEDLSAELPYFSYYQEAYTAVLAGMVGEYEIEEMDEKGTVTMVKKYGLKAFHPIAKGFPYTDYDDFGVSRSYGYERQHLGHDLMGQTGTPIVAVESGYVEALGWNQYGGWRIGIRSFDGLRYYYYAHLRQGFPYQPDLEEGTVVLAGDVIGYMGHTGYSATEDTNNIDETHLHFGMQLIFDESQKEGNGEIWIDCYQIVGFLYRQQSEVKRDDETKAWRRVYQMKDPAAESYERTKDFSMYP
ncbi:MAG: M23 family metallopeptidase [Lachnospiraceae bacterium]|nr:M23 family metallopeptidase [Lachnospiraceae bacterium]